MMRLFVTLFFALSCISCHTEARNMNSLRIDKLFEKTKAVCFGRFVVDVPVGVTVVGGPQTFNGAIETMPSSSGSASRVIEAKARELRATKHAILSPDGHPKLLHFWPVKLLQAGRLYAVLCGTARLHFAEAGVNG